MKKRQQISRCGTGLCTTIPQKVVETFDISTKRFFEWEKKAGDIIGIYCQSETMLTTRIQVAPNNRYLIQILPLYVKKHKLAPTKQGGPMAIFDWDETSLQICIHVKKVTKPEKPDAPDGTEDTAEQPGFFKRLFSGKR